MADIKIDGKNYLGVNKVVLPTVQGGSAEFMSGGGGSELFEDLVDRSISQISSSDLANITEIGQGALMYCNNLTTLVIPSNIITISAGAIIFCSNLTSITISEGCTTIGDQALGGNTSLEVVYLPSTLQTVGDQILGGNTSLTDIYYNSTKSNWNTLNILGVPRDSGMPQQITVHCTDGDIVYNEPVGNMVITYTDTTSDAIPVTEFLSQLGEYESQLSHSINDIVSIVIPEDVTMVSEYAFSILDGNTNNVTIEFPSTVNYIGDMACSNNLGSVYVKATTPPGLGYDPFANDLEASYTIYVPTSVLSDYQNDGTWSQYSTRLSGYNFN